MECILNTSHMQEVKRYIDFFSIKRKETLNEVQTAFSQILKNISKDEVLSWAEVDSLVNDLKSEIQNTIDSELQNISYMSGVYLKILMSQAESSNVQLQGDLSFIENEKAIEEMKNLGVVPDAPKKPAGRLPTLTAGLANEQLASARVRELSEENLLLKRKITDQQVKITELLDELSRFKSGLEGQEEGKEVSQVLEETKLRLRTKEELIESLKLEQEKRLADSKQFQNLKKLIQSKNDQIKELRQQ